MEFVFHQKMKLLSGTTHDWIYTEAQLTSDKRMISFVVLLLFEEADTMHEIVKHDCAHGKYHVHRYYLGPHAKIEVSEEPISNELYQRVKLDVMENGVGYRERFMRRCVKNQ